MISLVNCLLLGGQVNRIRPLVLGRLRHRRWKSKQQRFATGEVLCYVLLAASTAMMSAGRQSLLPSCYAQFHLSCVCLAT